jgi:hypothetical protein
VNTVRDYHQWLLQGTTMNARLHKSVISGANAYTAPAGVMQSAVCT